MQLRRSPTAKRGKERLRRKKVEHPTGDVQIR
jgi:hypothetical protein